MAKFQVTGPDGQKYEVTAPDDATEEQVIAYAQQNMGKQSAMGGSPNAFKEAGKSDPVRSVISTLQGPLMNFADEGLAAVQGGIDRVFKGIPFDTARQQWRDYYRGATEGFAQDNPVLAPVLQAGAGMATGVAGAARGLPTVAGMIAPTTAEGRIGTAALAGAGAGALGGAGSADTLADVPAEATKGAALGGITGGVLNAVGQGGGAVGRNVIGRAGTSSIVQDRLRDGGVGGAAARYVANTADDLARQRVATALTRDGRTAAQTTARLNTLGDDATLAVAGGKNTLNLLDTMATMPGRTANEVERAIRVQQAGRAGRLTRAAQDALGTNGARLNDTVEALVEQRAQAAAPLYAQLRQVTLEADDTLASLIQRAQSQGADRIARNIAETRGAPFTLANVAESRPGTLGVGVTPGTRVSMSDLDYLKEGLDDLIRKQTDAAGSVSRQGYALINLRSSLLNHLDDATNGLYRRARDAFAGPSALIDAAEAGRRAMRMDDVGIQGLTRGMSQSELEAFRVGAFESIRAKVGKEGGQTELLKMWKEPATQEKLRALFPDIRSYREFAAEVGRESRKKALEGVGRGAQTATRQAGQDDEAAAFLTNALEAGAAAKTGSLLGIGSAIKNVYGRTVMPEPVRDQIGSMLLQRGPQAQGLLGDLSRYVQAEQSRRAAAAARSGLLGGVGINSLLGN